MSRLRIPFFLLALLAILVIVLIERSALRATDVARQLPPFITGSRQTSLDQALEVFTPEQKRKLDELRQQRSAELGNLPADLSGFGVASLQFVDAFLLFTLALMGLSLLIPEYIHAKIQGVLTLIFAILLILLGLVRLPLIIAKLVTMVALLLSFPFGTIAYLIIFGSFPRAAASAVLSLIFTLKLVFGVLLLLAHQRFIENKGLVVYVLVAFVANLIVSILYGIVPGILVSITDAIAAIIVIIIGIILGIILIIGAIISIVMALKPV